MALCIIPILYILIRIGLSMKCACVLKKERQDEENSAQNADGEGFPQQAMHAMQPPPPYTSLHPNAEKQENVV